MKPAHAPAFPLRRTIAWPIAASLPMLSLVALAQGLPSGGRVTAGQAAIEAGAANALVIRQATPKAVVRWNDFSIGNGRSVTFAQPDAKGATLNIVDGNQASTIAGQLRANGSVLLVNPSGIAITPSGRVDVTGGFVASTLSILEDDFLAGRFLFTGKGGAVSNQGRITVGNGGFVGLLGSTVANDGEIRAPLGRVMLGSAQRATLDLHGDGYLQVLLPADVAGDGALVTNSGRIDAEGGTVVLKAATVRTAIREAVSMPGEIRARSVSGHDGAIVLDGGAGGGVTVSGRLDASGNGNDTRGGRIDVTGESVALKGATVEATGHDRGGLVRIGGEFQGGRAQDPASDDAKAYVTRFGATPPVASANTTKIDAASRIDVSSAQGQGGTAVVWSERETVMNASLDARGGGGGGAVEISSKSTIQSVDLGKVKVGKGGRLLLDPADIQIDGTGGDTVNDYTFTDNTGGTTTLKESDVVALLEGGTSVTLQASNDIRWANAFSFVSDSTSEKGNLTLEAGRSVTMSGAFTYGSGTFTVTANSANASVVDADRQAGVASIDMRNLVIANSNGPLVLKLEDGGGLASRTAAGIDLPSFNGNSLSATVSTGAQVAPGTPARIAIGNNINVANGITLTGPVLQVIGDRTLTGTTVSWANEKTGGTLTGENNVLKFVENGVTTRYGTIGGTDPARVALGNPSLTGVSRAYGDAEPDPTSLAVPPIQVQSHSSSSPSLTGVVPAGALAFTGPGVTAAAGSSTVTLGPTATFSIASGFFADLTTVNLPLTITQRTVTATALNPSYTYGSPAAAVTLNNLVNGDRPLPVATLAGTPGVTMEVSSTDYAFATRTAAGNSAFTVTGLSGTGASNYSLTAGTTGNVNIAQKPLTYAVTSTSQVYGTGASVTNALSGIVAGDSVQGVGALTTAGSPPSPVALSTRTPVGTYNASVASLTGTDAANYTIAGSGNTDGTLTITPKSLTWSVANQNVTYGTLAASTSALTGVVAGDDVSGTVATTQVSTPVTLTDRTSVGTYSQNVTTLAGADKANYTLAGSGNSTGTLVIGPKTLSYTGTSLSQVYGTSTSTSNLPAPALQGVLAGDDVSAAANVFFNPPIGSAGGSNAPPVGNYTVSLGALSGAQSGNYVMGTSNTPNSVTVTARPLTFSTANTAATYGTAATVATPVMGSATPGDSLVAGDNVWGNLAVGGNVATTAHVASVQLPASTAAGSYPLTPTQLFGVGASNYSIASTGNTTGVLTVAPKSLTWSVSNAATTYGSGVPNPFSLTGVVAGDTLFGQTNVVANGAIVPRPPVGTHSVEVTSLFGLSAGNYVLATTGNTPGTLTVTPRPLTYSITDTTNVYGTQPTVGTVTLSNVVAGDATPAATVGAFSGNTAVALVPRTNAGSYATRVTALGDPNYTIANFGNTDGQLVVTQKPVRFATANASSTYGSPVTLAAATLQAGDVLAGDVVTATNSVLQSTGNGQDSGTPAGTYAITAGGLTGAQAGNYQLQAAGSTLGNLVVAPRPVTYTVELANGASGLGSGQVLATYGQLFTPPRALTFFSNVVNNDTLNVSVTTPNIPVSTAGFLAAGSYTYAGSATLTGAAAANYVLSPATPPSSTLVIRPSALELVLQPQRGGGLVTTSTYGSSSDVQPGYRVFRQAGGADLVTPTVVFTLPDGSTAANLAARAPVGNYPLQVTGLTGADAGNYTVSVLPSFSLQVTPKPIVASMSTVNATYGDPVTFNTVSLPGVLAGDTVTPVVRAQTGSGVVDVSVGRPAAGQYTAQLISLAGSDAGNYSLSTFPAAFLVINPRLLNLSFNTNTLTQTYGGFVDTAPTLGGVLSGDQVGVTAMARPITVVAGGTGNRLATSLLDAGTYDYFGSLTGSSAANYTLPRSSGTITITPKAVTASLAARTTPYGTLAAPQTTLTGILAGQTVDATVATTNAQGTAVTYSERTDAGNYTARVTGLSGSTAPNYELQNSGTSASLTVTPKALTLTGAGQTFTSTYGTASKGATLAGILFNDDVGVMMAAAGGTAARATLDSSGAIVGAARENAGLHTFTVQAGTVGTKASNYSFANAASFSVNVEPKPVVYAVDSVTGQYGNYQTCVLTNFCQPWVSGITLGKATLQGVLAGDTVNGTVGLIDFKGESGTLSSQTPVGQYFEVVTGLTGAQAANYKIASSGSLPGILEITPVWTGYKTTSAVYLPSTGLVGVPGIPTMRIAGKDGPLNGDTVTPIVQMQFANGTPVSDPTKLVAGSTYYFRVVGFQGKDAANYRVLTTQGHGPESIDAGTLDVFASSTLGLDFAKAVDVPKPPAVKPPAPAAQTNAPGTVGIQSDNFGANLPSFGRNITTTGVDFDATAGPTGARTSGAASGVSQADVNVAGGNLSGQASGYVDALASVGVTGVSLEANANAHVDVTFKVGAGFVTYGAQADAQAEAQIGRQGAQVSAEARVGTYTSGGASGSIGAAGTGSVSATTGAFAYAKADNEYTFKDGKIVAKIDESFGTGVSAGVTGGISGSNGSVSAGATVYSPGVVGGSFDWAAGYKDGTISLNLDLGIKALLGGLELNLGFSINLDEASKTIANSGFSRAVTSLFGIPADFPHGGPWPDTSLKTAAGMTKDPAARFQYLLDHPEWMDWKTDRSYSTTELNNAYYSNQTFYENYKSLLDGTVALIKAQNDAQKTFMDLLKTNPQAAIDMAHSGTFRDLQNQKKGLQSKAWSLGVHLTVKDGKPVYVNGLI